MTSLCIIAFNPCPFRRSPQLIITPPNNNTLIIPKGSPVTPGAPLRRFPDSLAAIRPRSITPSNYQLNSKRTLPAGDAAASRPAPLSPSLPHPPTGTQRAPSRGALPAATARNHALITFNSARFNTMNVNCAEFSRTRAARERCARLRDAGRRRRRGEGAGGDVAVIIILACSAQTVKQ